MLIVYRQLDRLPVVEWPYAIAAWHERNLADGSRGIEAEVYVFMLTNGKISAKSSQMRSYRWLQSGPTIKKGGEFVHADTIAIIERVIEKWQIEAYKKLDIPFLHAAAKLVDDSRVLFQIVMRDVIREHLRDIGDETRIQELREFISNLLTIGEIHIKDMTRRNPE